MAEDQAAMDRSQESLDYQKKREFRSDQSEGRLSLNDTLQSECGSEGGQGSEGSSEQNRKRSRSRLSKWNKLLPRIRTISLPSERCLEVMAIEPQFEETSESIKESNEKIEGFQTKIKTQKRTISLSSEQGMEGKGVTQAGRLSPSIQIIDLKARSALQEIRKRTPRIRTISLPSERSLEMKALYPTESIQQMRESFKKEVEEVLKVEVIKEEDSDSTNTDKISDKISIQNFPIENPYNLNSDIDLNKKDSEIQNSEFNEDILDIPKEEKKYSEKDKNRIEIDSQMSHTAIECPDVLKALNENEPIILEMTDTLKSQLDEVSIVLKEQMEKISGELKISSLKFEKDILDTDEKLPYIDENGHEIIPSLKKSSVDIPDDLLQIYSVTEFKESEENSNEKIITCHDVDDEASIITEEPDKSMFLDQRHVIKTENNEFAQFSTPSQETETVSQVQNHLEIVNNSDISSIKVQGISEEATCESQNTKPIEETAVFDTCSTVLNVISDYSNSINTKEQNNILDTSVEVASGDQSQKTLEINEISEKLGEYMSKSNSIGKGQEITETRESLIHLDTSEDVTTKQNSNMNTEEIEDYDINKADVPSSLEPHIEKKKSKFREFNKKAGASIHGFGESVGESGREVIIQAQKKVTQSTSKLKQRISSDLSRTTEIYPTEGEENDGVYEKTKTDNFDDIDTEKVSTNLDTKAKQSKVHEWNKKAGARIHALGESVDDARHEIVRSLQKKDNPSSTRDVDFSDQFVAESVIPNEALPDEISGMPQKDIQDETVMNDQQNTRKRKKSKLTEWDKRTGAQIHGLGEAVEKYSQDIIGQVQKEVSNKASLIMDKGSSSTRDVNSSDQCAADSVIPIEALPDENSGNPEKDIQDETVTNDQQNTRKRKKSKLTEWDKRTGAQIHSLGGAVEKYSQDIIGQVQKEVSNKASLLMDKGSSSRDVESSDQCVSESVISIEALPDENSGVQLKDIQDEIVTNDQQATRKRKKSKLTEWDKRTGAQIHGLGEAVEKYSQDIIGQVQKEVSNKASLLVDKGHSVEVTQATEFSIDKTVEGGDGQSQIDISDINESQSEIITKNKPSKLHQWDKQTGARIHSLGENIEGSSKEMIKHFKRSLIMTSNTENTNDTVDTTCSSEDEILQMNLDDKSSDIELDYKQNKDTEAVAKKSTLSQWNKQAGAHIHAMGETVGEGSQEALKKVQKGLTHSATLLKDKLPSVGSTQQLEESSAQQIVEIETGLDADNTSQGEQTSDEVVDGTRGRSSKVNDWNKRTGAQIYHMTGNVGERGRDVIKRVKRSVSRPRSMPVPSEPSADVVDDTEDMTAEETNVMNISIDGSVSSKKSKSGFKQWDKKTGAKIHRLTESVGDRGRDVIKNVRKNISRPASVPTDMDANKDDRVSTVSKVSESSQERRKKSKFQEWNKKTGAQMHHITGTATDRVRTGITTVANSPPVEAATERGRVLVRQATATLKSRTASMPRGASAPGTDGDINYSSTLPRHRGASSSPSRGGTLKRLSANLPPLPQQLRKVFPGRDSMHQPRDPSPSKPSRRQGPVGRTWVKVYDDISYVDDRDKNNEDDYPVLGHRIGPTVLPNAKALPTPPTPPPPRARHANKPIQDFNVDDEIANYGLDSHIDTNGRGRNNNRFKGRREKRTGTPMGRNDEFEDEGDALRRSARLEAPQGAEEDDYIIPETLMPAKPVRGIKVYEDVIFKRKQQDQQKALEAQIIVADEIEIEEPKQQEQDMHRQQNIIEAQIIVADEIEIEEPKKPQRGVKIYEDIIFKRKQEKENQLLDEIKISQEQEVVKQIEDSPINKEDVLPPVQKPQRGIKVYEGINFKHQQEKQKEMQKENKPQETIKETPVVEDKPAKPQRGIKIYDKIEFKSVQYTFETDIDESVSEVTLDEPSTSSEVNVIDGSLKDVVPSKPERGNKVYGSLLVQRHESSGQVLVTDVKQAQSKSKPTEPVSPRLDELKIELQNSHLSLFEAPALEVDRMDVVKAHAATVEAQVVENSIPATPKVEAQSKMEDKGKSDERTEKVKVTALLEDVRKVEVLKTVEGTPQVEVTTKVVDTAEIYKNISKTNDIEIEIINPEADTEIPDGSIPPYARVHKETGGVGPLRSLTPADSGDEDGPPPPIPPKKVGLRTITPTASFDLPPRPSRHLKPTHLKPVRGNKPRRPQINGEILPSRPQRGTKLYADVEPAKPKRHSKVIRIEDVALMKEDLQELSIPSKPSRQRRKSEKENVLEYEDVPEAVTARLTVALDHPAPLEISTDFYENVELKDGAPIHPGRSRMRGRPPPPPPPKKGNIQKNYLERNGDQSTQPTNKVDPYVSDTVVAQEVNTTDCISTPNEVCTTTILTTTTGSSSQLETDIDHNLKNIESSFATLDDVLQSLKSYSRESSRNRRVILGESDKERAKLEMEVNKRLEIIQSAEVLSADYQNVEVKSGEVTVKKASVSENDYKEEASRLIQLPDKIEVKAERNAVQNDIKVAMTVSETQVLEKSKDVQSVICMPKNAKLNEGTGDVKEAYAVEETQTVEKTQSLQKMKDAQSEVYTPKNAIVKDVKDEETSEVKVAVSVEVTQTNEKASEVQCGAIKAHAELKDVKDEETEKVKVAVTVQELQFVEKTSEVSSEVVKAHAEVKDVKDEETEEVKVAVTVVELQTEGKTSEAKSGEVSKQVEEPLTVQVSSDEVTSKVEADKTEVDQQAKSSDSKDSDEQNDTEIMETAILQAGVADIASRLEEPEC